ncbi:hypothetical protein PMAYCL1PPCAC_07408 [Pristionchus mayeri]|uniref:Acyl-CoA thioesterase II n=1 Tax=Pristionchus mayeri TaxID=1317129 RepID=A0AAN4ZET3_9BILA|nr:hypothetical protein PMAYCL1PPCAC_07408 [Pristionchus mayeri]
MSITSTRSIFTAIKRVQRCFPLQLRTAASGNGARTHKFFDFERVANNVFRSVNLSTGIQQSESAAYGGVALAQSLAAAELTTPHEYKPHSIHFFFILSVDTTVPVEYHVTTLKNGKTFCTRSVTAIQNGKVATTMQVSFHLVEPDAIAHQIDFPIVKSADECPDLSETSGELLERISRGKQLGSVSAREVIAMHSQVDTTLFEVRCTDTDSFLGTEEGQKRFFFWVRAKVVLDPSDERIHRWMTAFASDFLPAGVILRPHASNDFIPSMVFSLSHVLHFHHHEIKADDWLLYEVESTRAGSGRGFADGRIWRADGKLLASLSQEILVRTKGTPSRNL